MFSESINNLINSSNMVSAQSRVLEIEKMIQAHTQRIQQVTETKQANKPTEVSTSVSAEKLPSFSELLKSTPVSGNYKYKVVPPIGYSKGELQKIISDISKKHNIDEKLVNAIVKQESGFNPNAVSKAGATGLMQLMPSTAKTLGVKNPYDPIQNVEGGVKHLKYLLGKYNGNVVLTLAAYNAGTGNVQKYNGVPPFKETQNYVRSILSNYLGRTSEGT